MNRQYRLPFAEETPIATTTSAQAITNKLRGGYYTSEPIAHWLCAWAIASKYDRVLEPSCGDGAFVVAAANALLALGATKTDVGRQVWGVDIVTSEVDKASQRLRAILGDDCERRLDSGDWFAWLSHYNGPPFNCVVGNPPFIRYQNFPEPSRSRAMRLMKREGLRPNKLTNIWAPFVVGAVSALAPGGRLAMVLPAELLQVSYAAQLRSYLVDRFASIQLFACNEMLFDGAQQEVVLLLASGRVTHMTARHSCRINLIEAETVEALCAATPTDEAPSSKKAVQHDCEKWLKYFLSAREISLMRALKGAEGVSRLGQHAEIDVGVVTGKNEFFVLSADDVFGHGLEEHVVPAVGRSSQLLGAIFTRTEWGRLAEDGVKVYLLRIDARVNGALPAKVIAYIRQGEQRGHHLGYKCRIRDPWYAAPGIWAPDCFFFRQIYDFPRVVLNRAGAVSTDTIHRLRCSGDAKILAASLYTHLTAASAEIEGRSYGGGVLELEPTEAERLLLPQPCGNAMPLEEIDRLVRAGQLPVVLEENDRRILVEQVGLTKRECALLQGIWTKMRDRRKWRRRVRRQA